MFWEKSSIEQPHLSWNRSLEHMRKRMLRILTATDEEEKTDEVETVRRNGREDVEEATCDTDDKKTQLRTRQTDQETIQLQEPFQITEEIVEYRGDFYLKGVGKIHMGSVISLRKEPQTFA